MEREKIYFRRLTSTDKKELKGKTRRHWRSLIYKIHSYNPSTIFLTQGSTIPYGQVLKEAYKNAFPNERQPNFLIINVKRIRELEHSDKYMDKVKGEFEKTKYKPQLDVDKNFWDFEHKYIKKDPLVAREIDFLKNKCDKYIKDGGKILILDEDAIGPGDPTKSFKDPWTNKAIKAGLLGAYKYVFSPTLSNSYGLIENSLETLKKKKVQIKVASLHMEKLFPGISPWVSKPINWAYDDSHSGEIYNPDWEFYKGEGVLRPRNKEEREIVKDNIVYLKSYGKEIGESYRKRSGNEKKRKRLAFLWNKDIYSKSKESDKAYLRRVENNQFYLKGIEGKLGAIIGIAGLGAGLFFLSSNVTGNVIANLTQNSSNFIGIGCFILGLIGAFFYFRKK